MSGQPKARQPVSHAARSAMTFVLMIGAVSFFADFTYEGARGVLGPYLASLNASAFTVGAVVGFGELLGYGVRYFVGRLADRTGRFWPITIAGYVLQMAVVPALALTGSWESAAVLIILERLGKGIRNPPRDVMLSHAAGRLGGYGWTFGIHEACDQFGAMFGPLAVAWVLARHGSYHEAFAVLLVPAVINILLVLSARLLYPKPEDLEGGMARQVAGANFSNTFWIYLAGAALVAAGFADYPLLAYHFAKADVMPIEWIVVFYAIAMAVSGTASLVCGRLFDRYGFRVLASLTVVASLFAPLAFLGGFNLALVGAALWGVGMGVHESIIPAAVAPMVPAERRASAFGLFTAGYGVFWFLGSAAIGFIYGLSIPWTVVFCMLTQWAAVPIFLWVGRRRRRELQLAVQ